MAADGLADGGSVDDVPHLCKSGLCRLIDRTDTDHGSEDAAKCTTTHLSDSGWLSGLIMTFLFQGDGGADIC